LRTLESPESCQKKTRSKLLILQLQHDARKNPIKGYPSERFRHTTTRSLDRFPPHHNCITIARRLCPPAPAPAPGRVRDGDGADRLCPPLLVPSDTTRIMTRAAVPRGDSARLRIWSGLGEIEDLVQPYRCFGRFRKRIPVEGFSSCPAAAELDGSTSIGVPVDRRR
jgi:hypothetical protein